MKFKASIVRIFVLLICSAYTNAEKCNQVLMPENAPAFIWIQNCECPREGDPKHVTIHCKDTRYSNNDAVYHLRSLVNITDLYKNLRELKFTGNTMTILPQNILGNEPHKSFWDLDVLDLSNNKIERISGKSFHTMPMLEKLVLNDNEWEVSEIYPRIFSSFFVLKELQLNFAFSTSSEKATDEQVQNLRTVFEGSELYLLEKLFLERNNLKFVDAAVFQSLPSLKKISLRNNSILTTSELYNATCHEHTFGWAEMEEIEEPCRNLQEFDISLNQLHTITQDFIDELNKNFDFNRLRIGENPFVCDCQLLDFYDWLKRDGNDAKVKDLDKAKCSSPEELKGIKLWDLDRGQLKKCYTRRTNNTNTMEAEHSSHHASAGKVVLAIFLTIASALVVVVLVVKRRQVMEKGSHAVMGVRDFCCPRNYNYKAVEV